MTWIIANHEPLITSYFAEPIIWADNDEFESLSMSTSRYSVYNYHYNSIFLSKYLIAWFYHPFFRMYIPPLHIILNYHLCFSGGCGIRTHGTFQGTLVFKTSSLNHSDNPPNFHLLNHRMKF